MVHLCVKVSQGHGFCMGSLVGVMGVESLGNQGYIRVYITTYPGFKNMFVSMV